MEFLGSPIFTIVGIIAAIVTLASVMWIIMGRLVTKPRLRLEFVREQGELGPVLMCHFYNDPLSQWWFSLLNIKKQNIDEFSAMGRLLYANGQPVCELEVALHDRRGEHGDMFPLPASIYSVFWALVLFDDIGAFVVNRDGIRTYLEPDTYEIRMLLHAEEVDVRVMAHKFLVGVDVSAFDWVGKPYKVSRRGDR